MKRITAWAALLCTLFGFGIAPSWADSITLSPGASITHNDPVANGGAASATATGGSVGNISNTANGGTHIQTTTVTPIQNNTQITSQGQHQGQGQLQGQGQAQTYEGQQSTSVEVKTDVPRMAPPAVPAALSVSSLTCYGSWSIAASTPFGGVGAGFPTKDSDCERSRNAALLNVLGFPQAALALMAQNEDTAKALQSAGVKYPGQVAAVAPVVKTAAVMAPAPIASAEEPVSKCGKGMVVTPSGFCRWAK